MKKVFLFLSASVILSISCSAQINGISTSQLLLKPDPGSAGVLGNAGFKISLPAGLPVHSDYQVPAPPHVNSDMYPVLVDHSAAASGTAQEGGFPKGTFAINVGIGVGDIYWGSDYGTASGVAPTLILEYAITDKIGIGNIAGGLIVSYGTSKYNSAGTEYKYSATLIGLRGEYHFMLSSDKVTSKLDPYGGVMLGYVITNNPTYNDVYSPTGKSSGFQPGIFAGAHYFFADHIGAYAELGYEALFVFNIGLSFKFP
jgi:hypothetical protein